MNYYVKGDAANADKIKAAFEKLGYNTNVNGWDFNSDRGVYFTNEADKSVDYTSIETFVNLIKTHPNYKKLELAVEHEFKVGDWVVKKGGETFYGGNYAEQITHIENDGYLKCIWLSSGTWVRDNDIRLWTIEDAKDGDVLVDEDTNTIGIFEKIYGICWHSKIYCSNYNTISTVYHQGGSHEIKFTKPATKEQRGLLSTRIREAGCEWDADKKEFRKTLKVGDWVAGIDDEGDVTTEKIVSLSHNKVMLVDTDGCHTEYPKTELNGFHLWTIADAKDGDVLVSGIDNPFIYDGNIEFSSAGAYVGVSRNGRIRLDMFPSKAWTSVKDVKPATKEQRDLLFAKMREAGYEWDAGKKEFRKIIEPKFKVGDTICSHSTSEKVYINGIDLEQEWYICDDICILKFKDQDKWFLIQSSHYDIKNFEPLDPVLVRQNDSSTWGVSFFGRCSGGMFMCCSNVWFEQCIPFNEKTKHLLGTTDMCPDEYINW